MHLHQLEQHLHDFNNKGLRSDFLPFISANKCILLGSSSTVKVLYDILFFSQISASHLIAFVTSPGGLLVSI